MFDLSLLLSLEPHVSSGMSTFQMDKFVINDHLTAYRKLRQAIVEAKARLENLTNYGFDLDELAIKLKQAGIEYGLAASDPLAQQLVGVKIRRMEFEQDRKKTVAAQIEKEAKFFLGIIEAIVNTDFGGSANAVALFADPAFQEKHEAQFWTEKLARSVYSDLVNYGTISKGVLESIACLPPAQFTEILGKAAEQQLALSDVLSACKDTALIAKD